MLRLLDSSVWIEHFTAGSRLAGKETLFDDPASIVVSTINLFEVCRYVRRTSGEEIAEEIVVHLRRCRVVDVDAELAMIGVALAADHGLHLADALIAATAQREDAALLTLDADLLRLPFAAAP